MVNTRLFVIALVSFAVVAAIIALVKLDTTGEKGSGLGQAYDYDVESLAKIDPNLIIYEESAGQISTGLGRSRAIFVGADGRIYVAGDQAIRVFAENGNLVDEIKLADEPRCLTIAEGGSLYIGMKDHVEVYDAQKKRTAAWAGLGNNAVLTSIAVSKNDVFVADAGNRIVVHYDTSGNLINHIGKKDNQRNIGGFVIPSPYFDLAVGSDRLLRVVNPGRHRIEAYTFDGDLEFSWGRFSSTLEGFTGCCNPVNFAILADESFVTCEKGLVRVKIYDAEGTFAGAVAGPEHLVREGTAHVCELPAECQAGGFDVAVDSAGRVFVLDTIRNVVRVFARIEK